MVPPYEAPPTAWRRRSDQFSWRRTSYGGIAGLGLAPQFWLTSQSYAVESELHAL